MTDNREVAENWHRHSTNAYAFALGLLIGSILAIITTVDSMEETRYIAGIILVASFLIVVAIALYQEGKFHGIREYDAEEEDDVG